MVERVDAALQGFGQPRLTRPPRPEDPAGDDRLLASRGHPGPQVGQDRSLEHLGHLVRHAGHRVDDLVADRADQAGCGAAGLLDDRRPLRHVGLAAVVVGHLAAAAGEEPLDPGDDRAVSNERDVHDLGDRLPRDVVLRRPEAAAHDDAVRSGQRSTEGEDDPAVVVPDGLVEVGVDPRGRQLLAEPRAVRVGNLAEQQLGPDRHDLDPHRPAAVLIARRSPPAGPSARQAGIAGR